MKFNKKVVTILLTGIVTFLCLSIPQLASAQTNPTENAIGYLDNPTSASTVNGIKTVSGWFLDQSGVASIEVLVDGAVVGQADYGDSRSDVQTVYPQFNNDKSGFHYALDTSKFSDGQHTVSIRETGMNGSMTALPNRSILINNDNTRGYLDNPSPGSTLQGIKTISGWFLDSIGVAKVEVLVDGTVAGQATYGDIRTDVNKAYTQFNNGYSGFHYALDTSKFSDGQHTVSIRETAINGRIATLPGNTITIKNDNTIGYVDKPLTGSTLQGIADVSGWVLDLNEVASIEVLVDGVINGEAVYGDARADVQRVFPKFNNANSGFHYALDTTKMANGKHSVTIRETSKNGRVSSFPAIAIDVDNIVRGYIDNPLTSTTLSGNVNLSGWFLDISGAEKIEVLVDGTYVGQAIYGDIRTDVQKVYPQYNNGNSGFHYPLDTTKISDGSHIITVRGTGWNGSVTTLPNYTIKIENAAKGYVDQPASESTQYGTINVSGWLLDGKGISKIEVLVDNTVDGQAVYGDTRTDVQKVYPYYNNGNSGFHYSLDTTKYTDGEHNVTVRETANNGSVTSLPINVITLENNKLYLDNPVSDTLVTGTLNVSGWFLSPYGVAKVDVLVDGTVVGQAGYGDIRSDVQSAFPKYNNGNSGFHYTLDTTQFSDGKHTITIRGTTSNGLVITLPENSLTMENIEASLDNPISGKTLKKTVNVSGWFLDSNKVVKIEVMVDGNVAGQAVYGDARPDVQGVFPLYNDGNSGFHYTLDTSLFPDGQHTVTIRETAANGKVTTWPGSTVTFNQSAYTVFLDPGHGGSDSGATSGSYYEKTLNLAVANKVQALLVSKGYTVYMSRSNDTFIPLLDRSQMANDLKADIFVSIHTNSGPTTASGIESYYYEYDPNYPSKINDALDDDPERISKSITLANLIQQRMVSYTGAINRGTDGETFSVIRESAMPATLLEIGFISNASERQKLFTDSYQNTLAKSIADGIEAYFKTY